MGVAGVELVLSESEKAGVAVYKSVSCLSVSLSLSLCPSLSLSFSSVAYQELVVRFLTKPKLQSL